MTQEKSIYNGFLSGNQLKIIACITMLIDHIGSFLLPQVLLLRLIGRISMPLFAFTFGEGCHYTRNKGWHFAQIFVLGLVTSAAMSFFRGSLYGNILITLSLACLIIYALDALKKYSLSGQWRGIVLSAAALILSVALAVGLCCFSPIHVDYGIAGVALPVCVRLLDFRSQGGRGVLAALYRPWTVMLLFLADLVALIAVYGLAQSPCLFALPLIAFYSGRRGRHNLKGLFYIFYPAHLALLGVVYLLLHPDFLSLLF